MDGTNQTNIRRDTDRGNRDQSTSRNGQGGGIADRNARQAIHGETDVKKDMGPSVSNTYVAEEMTVTNNYNF